MRLFVALNFPRETRDRLWSATRPLRESGFPVRWVGPDRLHMTLKFIGEVEDSRSDAVARAVGEAAGGHGSLELRLRGVGAFPTLRNPRVLWVGVEGPDELGALRGEIEEALVPMGIEKEDRDFHPHVTLGRARRRARSGRFCGLEEAVEGTEVSEEVAVTSVELMRSRLRRQGPEYSIVMSHPLEG